MPDFATDLCDAVLAAQPADAGERRQLGRMIADTLAVAVAGFATPTMRQAMLAFGPGSDARAWNGQPVASVDDAILLNAAASHALDYDDLDTISSAHVSAVVLATLCAGDRWPPEDDLLAGLQAGVIAAQAIGTALGRQHYGRGWHATATIGVFAATAAAARVTSCTPAVLGNAFALAAAQSAGLQSNFGTTAKAMQAGFAAAAAARSLRLAASGIAGGRVFADGGFLDLYGGDREIPGDEQSFRANLDAISTKLYPCCFATHQMIAATLEARQTLGEVVLGTARRLSLRVPSSSLAILREAPPTNAVEAAFSAGYCVAAAVQDGAPTLRHFVDPIDPTLVRQGAKVLLRPDDSIRSSQGILSDAATLIVETNDGATHQFCADTLPGSGRDAATEDLIRRKVADCLATSPDGSAALFLTQRTLTLPAVVEWLPGVSSLDIPTFR